MIGVKVTSNVGGVAARFEKLWGPTLGAGVLKASEFASGEIRRQIAAWTSNTSARKTGALMRSFRPSLKREGNQIAGGAFSTLPYARIHNDGGTIKPKRGRALAIPMNPQAERRPPRAWQGLILLHHPPHLPVLVRLIGGPGKGREGSSRMQLMFVLKARVRIKPKHYIARATDIVQPVVREIVQTALREAADRALAETETR